MSWEVVSCWIEGHPGLASWVQAVGSILAILAAVWIAHRDTRLRRNAEREAWLGTLARSITVVDEARARVAAGFESAKKKRASEDAMNVIKSDITKSEDHLKEVMSTPGVDSRIYAPLHDARAAAGEAANLLVSVSSGKNSGDAVLLRLDSASKLLREMHRSRG